MSGFGSEFRYGGTDVIGVDLSDPSGQDERDRIEALQADRDRQVEDAFSSDRRVGCAFEDSGAQFVGSPSTIYPVGFDTEIEDTHGFYPSNTGSFVVPPGMGGGYVFTFNTGSDGDPGVGFGSCVGCLAGSAFMEYKGPFDGQHNWVGTMTVVRLLTEGEQVSMFATNSTGAGYNLVGARFEMYRVGN